MESRRRTPPWGRDGHVRNGSDQGAQAPTPGQALPLVEKYKDKLEKLPADQGGRLTLEKGDDPKEPRRALKAAMTSLNRRIRFPSRGEEGSLSFYLEGKRGRPGRRPRGEAEAVGAEAPKRKRGRPRKTAG